MEYVVGISGVIFIICLVGDIAYKNGVRATQNEAVLYGVASWGSGTGGNPKFLWRARGE